MNSRPVVAAFGFLAALFLGADTPAPTPIPTAPEAESVKAGEQIPASQAREMEREREKESDRNRDEKTPTSVLATFGGGCFWSFEAVFERVPGVLNVVSGYAGGNMPSPSYEMVHSGQTGHAEVVHILFNPKVISYEKLLKVFFSAHDPTTLNAQGDDFGTNYRSVIFYHDLAQKDAAMKAYKELTARRAFRSPIVTQLVPFRGFFPAEPEHQNYFQNHSADYYSQVYIIPKVEKLMHKGVLPSPARSRKRRPTKAQTVRGASSAVAPK